MPKYAYVIPALPVVGLRVDRRRKPRSALPPLSFFHEADVEFFSANPARKYRCRECSVDEMRALLRSIRPKFTGKDFGLLDEHFAPPRRWIAICRADRLCGCISRIYTQAGVGDYYSPGFNGVAPETLDDARAKHLWVCADDSDQWQLFRHRQWLDAEGLCPDPWGAA